MSMPSRSISASRVSTEVILSRIVSFCLRLTSRVASVACRSIGSDSGRKLGCASRSASGETTWQWMSMVKCRRGAAPLRERLAATRMACGMAGLQV